MKVGGLLKGTPRFGFEARASREVASLAVAARSSTAGAARIRLRAPRMIATGARVLSETIMKRVAMMER